MPRPSKALANRYQPFCHRGSSPTETPRSLVSLTEIHKRWAGSSWRGCAHTSYLSILEGLLEVRHLEASQTSIGIHFHTIRDSWSRRAIVIQRDDDLCVIACCLRIVAIFECKVSSLFVLLPDRCGCVGYTHRLTPDRTARYGQKP